jgi:hypothetical protein
VTHHTACTIPRVRPGVDLFMIALYTVDSSFPYRGEGGDESHSFDLIALHPSQSYETIPVYTMVEMDPMHERIKLLTCSCTHILRHRHVRPHISTKIGKIIKPRPLECQMWQEI